MTEERSPYLHFGRSILNPLHLERVTLNNLWKILKTIGPSGDTDRKNLESRRWRIENEEWRIRDKNQIKSKKKHTNKNENWELWDWIRKLITRRNSITPRYGTK